MSTAGAVLEILATPYRAFEGQRHPVQFAHTVDPTGVLRDLGTWLSGLASELSNGPQAISGDAADTLSRASGRFRGMVGA